MRKSWMLMLTFIVAILMLAACGDKDKDKSKEEEKGGQEEAAELELPEPDLKGIPETVAEINGEKITKKEFETSYQQQFQQAAMQSQMTGEEVNQDELKEQIAEGMVGQELLTQEANKQIKDVPEEDINKAIAEIVEQNQLENEEDLFAAFDEQGMKKDEVMSLIEVQVKVDQLIAKEAGDIEPTDEELNEVYDMMKEQQKQMESEEELPSFDEMKPDLVAQVKYQKEAEFVQTLVEKLREKGDVEIFL